MIPLIVLLAATLAAKLVGAWLVKGLESWPAATRAGLAAMFCFTAVSHFSSMREDLLQMVPDWVPQTRSEYVDGSGSILPLLTLNYL